MPKSSALDDPAPSSRRRLSREVIGGVALSLARADGGGVPPMRRVAAELGVDVAALYRHFENKNALVEHVARLASEEVELPKAGTGPWRDRCLALSEAIREGIRSHPELGFHGGGSPGANPFNARANGALAGVLFDAGLRERELLLSTQALLHQITAVAESEVLARATPHSGNRRFADLIGAQLAEDVRAAWPKRSEGASGMFDFDNFFRYSVEIHLDAIDARLAARGNHA